jgi:linoleoyl-CoA desaturase
MTIKPRPTFAAEIDAIRHRVEAELGSKDVAYVKRLRRASRALEWTGRLLIPLSPDPVSFLVGVGALWLHKQLEATEIGHPALHGAWDRLPDADEFSSESFRWRTPIDEESWRGGHNVRHHQYTNVAGGDPDIHFGPVRLTAGTPHRRFHYIQVPWLFLEASSFLPGMNLHFTGVVDALFGNGRPEELDFLEDRSPKSVRAAWKRALRKMIPYYTREYVLFPVVAGPLFWKVLAGNWLSEVIRNLYTAATIYCGHVDAVEYPEGTRAHGRGEWYRMQIEAANNFEVPLPISILCGALDRQIEHHLFPRFPPNRLRQIAPEVREACRRHGVEYKTDSWGGTLKRVIGRLWRLSFPDADPVRPPAESPLDAGQNALQSFFSQLGQSQARGALGSGL